MIAGHDRDDAHAREIARGLAAAVRAAVESARAADGSTHTLAWGAATGVADLLELEGLTALLAACEAHAEAPPLAVANVLDRLTRLAAETEIRGEITPFVAADRELGALAGMLRAQEWSAESARGPAPVAVQSLRELLAEFEVDDPAPLANAQLTLQVAAGLRAALDWLGADAGGRLRVQVQDAALTLGVRVSHEPGLAPAGAVLALTSGALLPEPDGRWLLRVPLHVPRPAYLLARQGELALAVPWAAVARLRIADDTARAVMTEPSLAPWSPLARERGERPAALIAQGLSRAWLHLDHIVWRVFASPEPGPAPAAVPGGRLRVRTEEGAEFWVVDPGEALRGVPPLEAPPPRPRPRAATAEPAPAAKERHAEPAREPAPLEPAAAAAPVELTPDHVRPLPRASEPRTPAAVAAPPAPAPPAPPAREAAEPRALDAGAVRPVGARPQASPVRRALIVDDSLVARLALARVLEREGWRVEEAEHADDMWSALREQDWSAVFVDVHLPQAGGRSHLRTLVQRQAAASPRFEIVALTRDSAEQRHAREAGITRVLRKPFAPGAITALLRELPAPATGS